MGGHSTKNYSPVLSETSSLTTIDGGDYNNSNGGQRKNTSNNSGYNVLGIPRSSIHRWLPSQQRNLLQKQAELFVQAAPQQKKETDIF